MRLSASLFLWGAGTVFQAHAQSYGYQTEPNTYASQTPEPQSTSACPAPITRTVTVEPTCPTESAQPATTTETVWASYESNADVVAEITAVVTVYPPFCPVGLAALSHRAFHMLTNS